MELVNSRPSNDGLRGTQWIRTAYGASKYWFPSAPARLHTTAGLFSLQWSGSRGMRYSWGAAGVGWKGTSVSMDQPHFPGPHQGMRLLTKVPAVTVYFWIVKLLTTAMGESTSDYLVYHMNPYVAVILGFIGFTGALILQFAVRKYVAWVYWLLVVMVAIFGTMVADVTHVVLGVPYYVSTIAFAIMLGVVFTTWYKVEKTLSIHTVHTRRREVFYWAAVLATFAMGTAAGDMAAMTLHLGYLASGILFMVLFLLPGVCYAWFGLDSVFAFWSSYVMTRPLGASFADWLGKPTSITGLGYGDGIVAGVLAVLIVIFVGYLTVSKRDVQRESVGRGSGDVHQSVSSARQTAR